MRTYLSVFIKKVPMCVGVYLICSLIKKQGLLCPLIG